MRRVFLLATAAILLTGCGEDASVTSAKTEYRVVDTVDAAGSCEANELLLSAYYFSDKDRSISASGPALRANDEGRLVATCLTGGRNLRLICAALP